MDILLSTLEASRIVFTDKQTVGLEKFRPARPVDGELLVRTEFSLMSTGTENIVFNRLYAPGTHWDHWVKYPFYPGYSAVGIVEETGGGSVFKVGDRVASRSAHRSHGVVAATRCCLVPNDIPSQSAVWFALAKIAFQGARAAGHQLGDRVLIVGAGPVGQMALRWARAAGAAKIIVIDLAQNRLEMASRGGATVVVPLPIDQAQEKILAANDGRSPDIIIDSTGNAQVFAESLRLVSRFGKVVVLGDTGQPTDQKLTSDVVVRGVTIVGAHDGHNSEKWNDHTITELFFCLVSSGRFSLEGLNTHFFQPADYAEAYKVANRNRASTMGILFDWRGHHPAE